MNNSRDKTNPTNRVRTLVLCVFAFLLISGLMILSEYSELKDSERREQHILEMKNQIRKIKTHRREVEEARQKAALLVQEIIDRQAHYETADHRHPHAEQQLADLTQLRTQAEELLRRSDQLLAECKQMLQKLAD